MQVPKISKQQYEPNFKAVYLSAKSFSRQQNEVANTMIKEFKKLLHPKNKITLQDVFKKKGYDFVIEPKDNELISLNAYRGFRLEVTGVNRYATYNKYECFHVGHYNVEAVSNLANDLKKILFSF